MKEALTDWSVSLIRFHVIVATVLNIGPSIVTFGAIIFVSRQITEKWHVLSECMLSSVVTSHPCLSHKSSQVKSKVYSSRKSSQVIAIFIRSGQVKSSHLTFSFKSTQVSMV